MKQPVATSVEGSIAQAIPVRDIPVTKRDMTTGKIAGHTTFFFDPEALDSMVEELAEYWTTAEPFPHVAIDNFLPEWLANALLEEFPDPDADIDWYLTTSESRYKKQSTQKEHELRPLTRDFFARINSSDFVRFMEKVTGVDHLLPDPHLFGGGAHQTSRGGYLKIHADNNWDPKLLLHRRVNLIYYLNKDWKDEYGGHLELWNENISQCQSRIAPVFNRLVVFYNSEIAFHGHPEPMECPDGLWRKSLALYYYTTTRPKSEIRLPHTTKYKSRPGEAYKKRRLGPRVLKRFVPPIVFDVTDFLGATRTRAAESEPGGD